MQVPKKKPVEYCEKQCIFNEDSHGLPAACQLPAGDFSSRRSTFDGGGGAVFFATDWHG
jgi:hypothetical protein